VPFIKHLDGKRPHLDILGTGRRRQAAQRRRPRADIGWVKQRRDRITLLGNIDCAHLLTFGTPAEVTAAVKDIIRTASPGGGHVFASSNSIHSGVRPEIFRAMVDAVRTYGSYPISIPA
jgi:uroporphyrinogen decarboxylase